MTFGGQLVLDAHRTLGIYAAPHDALALQLFESLRQQAVVQVWDRLQHLREPPGAVRERPDGGAGPALPDELDSDNRKMMLIDSSTVRNLLIGRTGSYAVEHRPEP